MGRRQQPPATTVSELGEFPLIERLVARLGRRRRDVVLGPGDDVAALDVGGGQLLLATCDVQTAGTHFLPDRVDPHRLGRKVVAINVSDIAAAGGRPSHALVSLVLPADTPVDFLERLYDGIAEETGRWDTEVIGGNVSRGAGVTIDLTLLGHVAAGGLWRRDGARVGDRLLVTGELGAAAAGLHLLQHPALRVASEPAARAQAAFETPTPRVREAAALARVGGVTAAIDVSDGLVADVAHLCESSGVGVRLLQASLPVADAARAVAAAAGVESWGWAAAGGEDYELVFTAPAAHAERLAAAVREETGTSVTWIGDVVAAAAGRRLQLADGGQCPLETGGWRHF